MLYSVWTWAQRALPFAFDRACRDDKGFPEIRGNHQCSLVSADAHIALQNNPRRLGNANYAGYDDAWTFKYVVGNLSEWETTAAMFFPLPAKTGRFDEMYLAVNGAESLDEARTVDNALNWKLLMRPGENLAALSGDRYTLTWDLDNALTYYDIGLKRPVAEQPDYHFSRLLQEASFGLILLAVPRLITGEPVNRVPLCVMGFTYCLRYTFMGRLAELFNGFAQPFVISAAALISVMSGYRGKDAQSRRRVHDAVIFAIAVVVYPAVVVHEELTRLWMHLLYTGDADPDLRAIRYYAPPCFARSLVRSRGGRREWGLITSHSPPSSSTDPAGSSS